MKNGRIAPPTLILIGLMALILCSCGPKRRFLAAEATILHMGDPQSAVVELLGEPDATRPTKRGVEWYYYEKHRPFYGNIPLLRRVVGKERVNALMVLISNGRVADVLYYVAKR